MLIKAPKQRPTILYLKKKEKETSADHKSLFSVVLEFNALLKRWCFKFSVSVLLVEVKMRYCFLSSYQHNQPIEDESHYMINMALLSSRMKVWEIKWKDLWVASFNFLPLPGHCIFLLSWFSLHELYKLKPISFDEALLTVIISNTLE